jgi:protocatechuate 3,4-dioxygenase beta subunit
MRRVPFVAMLAFLASHFVAAQVGPAPPQGVRPGAPAPGAPVPGVLPPRDARPGAVPAGTGKLRGRVLAQNGSPLRRAQVTLTSGDAPPLRKVTTTDAEGRYEFEELPAGRFSINATKAGYVTLQYGQRRPYEAGTPVSLAAAQTLERVDFALPKGSVIVVRVTDEFGEPIAGAQIQVQRYQYGPDGQRRLANVSVGAAPLPFSGTDDRGEFRAFGLMPGEYVVQAMMRSVGVAGSNTSASSEGFSPTYHPGTISVNEAQPITVNVGEEASAQFAMVAARLSRITGTVTDSQGRPAAGAQVSLRTQIGATAFTSSAGGPVAADGTFALSGVSPGEHAIDVRTQPRNGERIEAGTATVTVGGADLAGVRIETSAGATITGRVVFEGTAPQTDPSSPVQRRVLATPADPSTRMTAFPSDNPLSNGAVDDEGNFRLSGVTGRVFLNYPITPAWTVKSVALDGEDITEQPLDTAARDSIAGLVITLTDKLTDVSGAVTDARGQSLQDYVVVIQPAEQREPMIASRLIRVARADTKGRFQVRGIRPGRYVATAIEALEQGRQFAPEFQQQLRRSGREFAVREGETVTVDLRLAPDL